MGDTDHLFLPDMELFFFLLQFPTFSPLFPLLEEFEDFRWVSRSLKSKRRTD